MKGKEKEMRSTERTTKNITGTRRIRDQRGGEQETADTEEDLEEE